MTNEHPVTLAHRLAAFWTRSTLGGDRPWKKVLTNSRCRVRLDRMPVARVVSGGQTGVDRAALDAAQRLQLPYGGWCPAGGWAEDMTDPPGLLVDYPHLSPTHSAAPEVRTHRNVHDSDATLVLHPCPRCSSPGSAFTVVCARKLGRPFMVTRLEKSDAVARWIGALPDVTLNIAGPRESEAPGAYGSALDLLLHVLAPAD